MKRGIEMKKTQNEQILRYLKTHKRGITPLKALELCGCMRLSGRIFELRDMGYEISSEIIAVKNKDGDVCHVANYKLVE